MYCKNCGKQLDANAAVCTQCGFASGTGVNYCQNCGAQVTPGQAFCVGCGASLNSVYNQTNANSDPTAKSRLVAGLLAIFLGSLGIHNFYLGYTNRALVQLLVSIIGGMVTCGVATLAIEIWALVEGIFYLTQHDGYTADASGKSLKD